MHDRDRVLTELNVDGTRVFSRFVPDRVCGGRELHFGPQRQLAELDSAQARGVKEELTAVFACDEPKLTVRIQARNDSLHTPDLLIDSESA
jgi:hypothetical protein